jgi:hypothetical protein
MLVNLHKLQDRAIRVCNDVTETRAYIDNFHHLSDDVLNIYFDKIDVVRRRYSLSANDIYKMGHSTMYRT